MENLDQYYAQANFIKDMMNSRYFRCSGCGGTLGPDSCNSCRKETDKEKSSNIKTIYDLLQKMIEKMPSEVEYSRTLNELYCIKEVPMVTDYMNSINYNDILQRELNSVLENGIDYNNKDDIEKYEFLSTNVADKNDRYTMEMIAFRESIINGAEFSDIYFENICKDVIQKNLSSIGANVIIKIDDINIGRDDGRQTLGFINGPTLTIDRETIRGIRQGNFLGTLALFHEMRHVQQKQLYKNDKKPDINTFTMLTDYLMSNDRNYYKDNYDQLSYELDANFTGALFTNKFLNSIGLNAKDKVINSYLSVYDDKIDALFTRTVDGKEKMLFDAFVTKMSNKPELLDNYPYLNYLYTKDNDSIRMKTPDEIEESSSDFDYSSLTQEELANAKQFFNGILTISETYSNTNSKSESMSDSFEK